MSPCHLLCVKEAQSTALNGFAPSDITKTEFLSSLLAYEHSLINNRREYGVASLLYLIIVFVFIYSSHVFAR